MQLLQVNKTESEEDDSLDIPFSTATLVGTFYRYSSDFKLLNKHFLVHYAAAIKGGLPNAYILHQNFRL